MSTRQMKTVLLVFLLTGAASSTRAQYQLGRDNWNFRNFTMTTDSEKLWRLYSRAFLDIKDDPDDYLPFDSQMIFFNKVIEGEFAGEHDCYGMSLLSLLCFKEGGHMGVCSPVHDYDGDLSDTKNGPNLELVRESIGIMHLRQMSMSVIEEFLDMLDDATFMQPTYHYNTIVNGLASKDYPVLTFFPSDMSGGAHSVVPIDTSEGTSANGNKYARIYLYDPNKPYSTNKLFYDTNKQNYLEIDMTDPNHYWDYPPDCDPNEDTCKTGGCTGEWAMIATHISDAKYKDRTLTTMGELFGAAGTFIFSGEGGVSQISDGEGRTFYDWKSGRRKIEFDTTRRIADLIRWPFFEGSCDEKSEIYFCRGIPGKSYTIEMDGGGKAYEFHMLMADNAVSLEVAAGAAGKDTLRLESIHTQRQAVQIGSQRGLSGVSLTLTRRLPGQKISRTFQVSDLTVKKGSPVRFQVTERMKALQFESPKSATSFRLKLSQAAANEVSATEVQQVSAQDGKVQEVSVQDWRDLPKSKLQIGNGRARKAAP
jgi:hypothetical protein